MTDFLQDTPEAMATAPDRLPLVFATGNSIHPDGRMNRRLFEVVLTAKQHMQEHPEATDAVLCQPRRFMGIGFGSKILTVSLPNDYTRNTADDFRQFHVPIERARHLGAEKIDSAVISAILNDS